MNQKNDETCGNNSAKMLNQKGVTTRQNWATVPRMELKQSVFESVVISAAKKWWDLPYVTMSACHPKFEVHEKPWAMGWYIFVDICHMFSYGAFLSQKGAPLVIIHILDYFSGWFSMKKKPCPDFWLPPWLWKTPYVVICFHLIGWWPWAKRAKRAKQQPNEETRRGRVVTSGSTSASARWNILKSTIGS